MICRLVDEVEKTRLVIKVPYNFEQRINISFSLAKPVFFASILITPTLISTLTNFNNIIASSIDPDIYNPTQGKKNRKTKTEK